MGSGASSGEAQRAVVSGQVLRGPGDGHPVAGRWAVLHEVTRGAGGPVDSARTDARGRYRLSVPRVDSTAVYVVSVWYDGLAYFSLPVNLADRAGAEVDPLRVFDASPRGPPLRLTRRVLTVGKAARDGTRTVLELVEIENPGATTRVPADSATPTWLGALPAVAIQFRVGEGDLSPEVVARRGDSVAVFGPVPPGPVKQLTYEYVIPADARRLVIPIDQPTVEADLLVEDTRAVVVGVESLGTDEIEQRRFARYRAKDIGAGASIVVTFPRRPLSAQSFLPAVVVLAALALGAGLWVALKRRRTAES